MHWDDVLPSTYDCEEHNNKWICSVITPEIKIKYLKDHCIAKNFQDQVTRFIEKCFCKHTREHSIHKGDFQSYHKIMGADHHANSMALAAGHSTTRAQLIDRVGIMNSPFN